MTASSVLVSFSAVPPGSFCLSLMLCFPPDPEGEYIPLDHPAFLRPDAAEQILNLLDDTSSSSYDNDDLERRIVNLADAALPGAASGAGKKTSKKSRSTRPVNPAPRAPPPPGKTPLAAVPSPPLGSPDSVTPDDGTDTLSPSAPTPLGSQAIGVPLDVAASTASPAPTCSAPASASTPAAASSAPASISNALPSPSVPPQSDATTPTRKRGQASDGGGAQVKRPRTQQPYNPMFAAMEDLKTAATREEERTGRKARKDNPVSPFRGKFPPLAPDSDAR